MVEELTIEEATARTAAQLKAQMHDPRAQPVDRVYGDLYLAVLPEITRKMQHWLPRVGLGVVGEASLRLAATIAMQVLLSARHSGADISDEEFTDHVLAAMRQALVACTALCAIDTGPRLDS